MSNSLNRVRRLTRLIVGLAYSSLSFELASQFNMLDKSDLAYSDREQRAQLLINHGWRRVKVRTFLNSVKLDGQVVKNLTDDEFFEVEVQVNELNNWNNTYEQMLESYLWLAKYIHANRGREST